MFVVVHAEPQLIRYGIEELLRSDPNVRIVEDRGADVVLVDPFPKGSLSPSLAIRRIAEAGRLGGAVIAYTWRVNQITTSLALRRGCVAIADKNWPAEPLLAAIRTAAHGGTVARPPDLGLTARQIDTVRHVAAGRTNNEIAAAQNVSSETVKADLSDVMRSHKLRNRAQVASWGIAYGLGSTL